MPALGWVEQYRLHRSDYLREIIERDIDEMEEYYLASEVRERVRKGEEEVLSSDQLREELGLAD